MSKTARKSITASRASLLGHNGIFSNLNQKITMLQNIRMESIKKMRAKVNANDSIAALTSRENKRLVDLFEPGKI